MTSREWHQAVDPAKPWGRKLALASESRSCPGEEADWLPPACYTPGWKSKHSSTVTEWWFEKLTSSLEKHTQLLRKAGISCAQLLLFMFLMLCLFIQCLMFSLFFFSYVLLHATAQPSWTSDSSQECMLLQAISALLFNRQDLYQ